jgi:hypothetical protein
LSRPPVEVADIFCHRGPAWRASHAGHVSLGQLKVMSAIERCRTAALGGHVERCEALPDGFHRIRHYGLFANGGRAENVARARQLLNARRHRTSPVVLTVPATMNRKRFRTLSSRMQTMLCERLVM